MEHRMNIFVGNCSHQTLGLFFRLPESKQFVNHDIPPGMQIMLDLTKGEADALIQHIEVYGATECRNIAKGFTGMCYSFDKEIPSLMMERGHEQMRDSLKSLSEDISEINAAVIDDSINRTDAVQQGFAKKSAVEVEVEGTAVDTSSEEKPTKSKVVVK